MTRSRARIDDVLSMLEIADLADRAPFQLSGGEKKRVAIASVLVMNPDVLLFDEPTAALDPRTQAWLVELILELNRAGKTIVMATHDLDILDTVADRCVVFSEDHQIAAEGSPKDVLADRELLLSVNLIHDHTHVHRLGNARNRTSTSTTRVITRQQGHQRDRPRLRHDRHSGNRRRSLGARWHDLLLLLGDLSGTVQASPRGLHRSRSRRTPHVIDQRRVRSSFLKASRHAGRIEDSVPLAGHWVPPDPKQVFGTLVAKVRLGRCGPS